ncbi:MAG: ABC transporter substrate-binding protein [Actinobacteria bacterium]|nr:ABC transporter substrate-binding protein [Actinomycetota bacterium]
MDTLRSPGPNAGRRAFGGVAVALAALTLLAACGGSADTAGNGEGDEVGELRQITVARPNPSTVNMFNLCSAWGEGYFEEEGLEVSTEAVDGVGAVLQAVVAGQAEIGGASAGPVLLAREQATGPDQEPVLFYNQYAQSTYGLVVSEESGYEGPADLADTIVGVGTADGAEAFYARSILANAGLEEGVDYETLAVGDAGPALAGFERGDIQSYAASLVDMAVLDTQGFPLLEITPEEYIGYFGWGFSATQAYMDANPEVIEGFTRAIVRGTEFGIENKEAALEHCAELNPEEGANTELTDPLFDTTADRGFTPQDGGPWGVYPPESWEAWQETLIESGELEGPVDDLHEAYTNDYAELANE